MYYVKIKEILPSTDISVISYCLKVHKIYPKWVSMNFGIFVDVVTFFVKKYKY